MPAPSRVTLQHIADKLGLSRATVSMALRETGRVSEPTRRRIRRTAREMGYQPDPLLSALSRHRRKPSSPGSVIAVIKRTPRHKGLRDPLAQPAGRLGYRLEHFVWDQYPTQKALTTVLKNRGIAGVLFPEIPEPPALEPDLWDNFRGVYCGPYAGGSDQHCPFDLVRHNPFDALTLAWQKARATGARRIGLIIPTNLPEPHVLDIKTLAAYRHWQSTEPDLPRLSPLIGTFAQLREVGSPIQPWVREQQPELIIGAAHAVHAFITNNGPRIPRDLRFISLRLRQDTPNIAGILLDQITVNIRGLHHLHALIQHGHEMNPSLTTSLVVNAQWRDGASCPPAATPGSTPALP